jgi:hypothetical protein
MLNTKPSVNWSTLDRYFTENKQYADKARELICNEIGFKPEIKALRQPELSLRNSLKRFDDGDLSQEKLDRHISMYSYCVKKNVLKYMPELAHLVDEETRNLDY